MTQPYANARVEVTLDFGQVEGELQTRLEGAVRNAVTVAIKHFEKLSKAVEKTTRQIRTHFNTAMAVIEARSRKAATNVGDFFERAGDRITSAMGKASTASAMAMTRLSLMAQKQASKLADAYEDAFDRIRNKATTVLGEVRAELRSLPNATVQVRVMFDERQALRELGKILRSLEGFLRMRANHITIFVDLDARGLEAQLTRLTRNRRIEVDVDVDRNGSINAVSRAVSGLSGVFGGIGSAVGAVGSALGSMAKMGAIAGTAVVGIGGATPLIAGLAAALGAVAVAAGGAAVAGIAAAGIGVAALKVGLGGVSDAFSALGDASASGAGAAADNTEAVEQAQRGLSRAVRDEADAQKDVANARRSALERLQDLNFEMRGAALSEKDAVLSLKEAQKELRTGKFDDGTERERAALRVEQAELRLAQTRESNGDLQAEYNDAQKKGVDGADEVVSANRALADATLAVKDAQVSLNKAMNPAAAGGVDKVAEAMAKLSPNAQAFARAVMGVKPAWDAMKKTVQDSLFAGLSDRIQPLANTYLPLLGSSMTTVADGFNEGAISALNFAQSGTGVSVMSTLLGDSSNMAANLGSALGNLIPGLSAIAAGATSAFSPLTDGMGSVVRGWSDRMVEMQQDGSMTEFFQKAMDVAKQFGEVLGNIGGIISGVFNAAQAGGGNIMGTLGQALEAVNAFVNSAEGQTALSSFFSAMTAAVGAVLPILMQLATIIGTQVAPIIAQLLTSIGPMIGPVLDALSAGITALLPAIEPIVELFADIADAIVPILPVLGELIATFVELAGPILGALVSALSPIIEAIGNALITALTALMPIMEPIGTLFEALSPIIATLAEQLGTILAEVITALMPIVTVLAEAFSAVFTAIEPLLPVLGDALVSIIQMLAPLIEQQADMWLKFVMAVLPILPPLIQMISTVLPILVSLLGFLLPIVMKLFEWFGNIWLVIVEKVIPIFINIVEAMTKVYEKIGQVIAWLGTLGDKFGTAMQWIKDKVGEAKDWIVDKFTAVVDWIKSLPQKITDAASGMWDGITGAFKGMVNGLIRLWNGLSDKLSFKVPDIPGMPKRGETIRPIPKIKELADGGRIARRLPSGLLKGPGGERDDMILGLINGMPSVAVSNDEMVMNGPATRRNFPMLAAMNKGIDFAKLLKIPGLADGGLVSAKDLIDFARGVEGAPYEWGGVNWGDCSGAVSAIANFASGRDPFGSRFATGSEDAELKARGFLPGLGPDGSLNVGWYNGGEAGGHTSATLPDGTNFEMGGARGDGQFGGQAAGASDPMYTDHAHLPPDHFVGLDGGSPTVGSAGGVGGSSIGGGLGGGTGGGGGGGATFGNSGGGSKFNSAAEASAANVTPVWVENWPAPLTREGGLATDTSTSLSTSSSPSSTPAPVTSGPVLKDLGPDATREEIAAQIYAEAKARGYTDEEAKAILSTAIQESNLDGQAVGGGGAWKGVFQQDESYAGRDDPDQNIAGFFDRLDEKRAQTGASGDIWKDIFWLQQRPGEPSANAAVGNGRQAYLDEIQSKQDEAGSLMSAMNSNGGALPVTVEEPAPVQIDPGSMPPPEAPASTMTPGPYTTNPTIDPSTQDSTSLIGVGPNGGTGSMATEPVGADWGAQAQDWGIAAIKEIGGQFLDPFGLSGLFESGFDRIVEALREQQNAAEYKYADTVNNYGMDPVSTEKAVTEGMSNITDTNRAAF